MSPSVPYVHVLRSATVTLPWRMHFGVARASATTKNRETCLRPWIRGPPVGEANVTWLRHFWALWANVKPGRPDCSSCEGQEDCSASASAVGGGRTSVSVCRQKPDEMIYQQPRGPRCSYCHCTSGPRVAGTVKTRIDFGRVSVYVVVSLASRSTACCYRATARSAAGVKGQRLLFKHPPPVRFRHSATLVSAWLECLPNC